ncbi:uncharacterized protein N7511_010079 [Penicillium nucicola]|uniref:uncharacterized protein n=1 Tax=Penicillium nucicola TaxID=1850975 RepID=UPI0025455094|nr:uncharacterized protein N7511_010079 [Penicillium nucicola]KAJ5748383.1 hypothetical protein N7511_010079 [Penicillium nucicola]
MIFKEPDFAMHAGAVGMRVMADGKCKNFDIVPDYRMNIGSIYVPCPGESTQEMMCSMYTDPLCRDEMFTFTRPHMQLKKKSSQRDIGSNVRSMKCMAIESPQDRQGRIFNSDNASTMNPIRCPNDTCSSEMPCWSMQPAYGMYCSPSSKTCQRLAVTGEACNENVQCHETASCVNGKCASVADHLRCPNGSECPSGMVCRPLRVMNVFGMTTVERVCMDNNDSRGAMCSAGMGCNNALQCSLQWQYDSYCEPSGRCAMKNAKL